VFNGPKNDMKHLLVVLLIACLIPGAQRRPLRRGPLRRALACSLIPETNRIRTNSSRMRVIAMVLAKQNTGVDPQARALQARVRSKSKLPSNRLRSKRSKTWVRAGR